MPLWVVKFVNGLLRNVVRNIDNIPFPEFSSNPVKTISVEKSFPVWLVQKWVNRFGEVEAEKLCDSMNSIPDITLRLNTLKANRETLVEKIKDDVATMEMTTISPVGISIRKPSKSIGDFQAFKDGLFQVQDEAAQIVSILLNPEKGDRVLDACAGLGGKTGHIAQLMGNQGEVIAADNDPKKLEKLALEMKRLGVSIVKTSVIDLNNPVDNSLGLFDKILIDAPCSGLGVLRRNPDSKWALSKRNLNRYHKRQVSFLENIKHLLKPGGVIVYAVCSTEPEEGKGVIDSFLHNSTDYSITGIHPEKLSCIAELADASGNITTLPHIHDMDGFFTTRLYKKI